MFASKFFQPLSPIIHIFNIASGVYCTHQDLTGSSVRILSGFLKNKLSIRFVGFHLFTSLLHQQQWTSNLHTSWACEDFTRGQHYRSRILAPCGNTSPWTQQVVGKATSQLLVVIEIALAAHLHEGICHSVWLEWAFWGLIATVSLVGYCYRLLSLKALCSYSCQVSETRNYCFDLRVRIHWDSILTTKQTILS